MTTEERLDKLERENQELREKLEKTQPNNDWPELREEIRQFCLTLDDNGPRAWGLQNAVYTFLRFALGIRNVAQINSYNIDQARKCFEKIKDVIENSKEVSL